jgi:D-alanyl-D-alanine dipeptidase
VPKRPDLVDLVRFDTRLVLDIRYAGANNFTGRPVYPKAAAWLQRQAAMALVRAHDRIRTQGLSLLVLDAYRPWHVTRDFWQAYPEYRDFVADPAVGSVHNRGCAVDVSLVDNLGRELPMPSGYDEFAASAYPDYAGGDAGARANRELLRAAMEAEGFAVHPREWWHFDHESWRQYPLLDIAFKDLS